MSRSRALAHITIATTCALALVAATYAPSASAAQKKPTVASLRAQLAAANKSNDKLVAQAARDKKTITSLRADSTSLNASIGQVKADLVAANAQVATLTAQLADAKSSTAGLTNQLADARSSAAALTNQLADARSSAAALTNQLAAMTSSRDALTSEMSSASAAVGGSGSLADRIAAVMALVRQPGFATNPTYSSDLDGFYNASTTNMHDVIAQVLAGFNSINADVVLVDSTTAGGYDSIDELLQHMHPDTSAPDIAITAAPAALTSDSTPTFGFSSDDSGATFACRVDAAAFAACTVPFTTSALGDGSHTFEVRATDPAGNTDASPASFTFTVDTTGPVPSITSGPSGPTNDDTPTFAFSASGGAVSFQCHIDSSIATSCTNPYTATTLSEGSHTFTVRAQDALGNADTATRTFLVDITPPEVIITSPTPFSTSPDYITPFTGTASDSELASVSWVNTYWSSQSHLASGTSNWSANVTLGNGNNTVVVTATDAAGNTGTTQTVVAWNG